MKKILLILLILFIHIMIISHAKVNRDDFPVLKGPYLGQKPPGKKPEIFAPGIVSTSDGKYLFFSSFRPDADHPGHRSASIYWVDAKIIEELRLKEQK